MSAVPPNAYGRNRPPESRQVPTPAGVQTVFMDEQPRCNGKYRGVDGSLRQCQRLLAEFVSRPWRIKCSKCGTINIRNTPPPPPA